MKRAHCVIVRACSWLTGHTGALIIGLAVVWMASAPSPAWGQWTGGPTGPIYYNGGNVGVGTSSPRTKLHLQAASMGDYQFTLTSADFVFASTGAIAQMKAFGHYLQIENLYNGGNNWGDVALAPSGGNVGIGTAAPQYKLAVNGTIGAKEVIVTNTGWPDYVFRPGYRLRPLSELGAYIRAHHHLPDIPSEAEVKEKGVSVGEMQAKLLAKVEELTLHMIQQDKENRELRERIAQLETRAAGSGAPAAGR